MKYQTLMQHYYDVHELQEENTALHLAAKQGHSDVLQKIMESTDEKNIVSIPFLCAFIRVSFWLWCYLLHIVIFYQDGMTALHLAAEGGHYECIRLLLEGWL